MIVDPPSPLIAHRTTAPSIRWRWCRLVIGLVILWLSLPPSRTLTFDRSIEAMFQPNDGTFVDYQMLKAMFGGNDVVMLVYEDAELATAAGITRNRDISDRVSAVPGVKGVLSPSLLNQAVEKFRPLIGGGDDTPALFHQEDPVAEGFDQLFAGYTHSSDHGHAAVVAMLEPDRPPQTLKRLRQLRASMISGDGSTAPIRSVALVGESILVDEGFSLIERDGARLEALTIALLSLVVVVTLIDVRFVLLTVALIGWSVVVTRATMVGLDINLSLVSAILTAIVTVISVTAVLHLGVRFRKQRSKGDATVEASGAALAALIAPIFWTCATDAAGFGALFGSGILPIRQFGVMIAVAAIAVCVAIVLFAPSIMTLPGAPFGSTWHGHQRRASRWLQRRVCRIAERSIRRRGRVLGFALIGLVVSLIGISRSEIETSFLNNFRPDSEVVAAYADVETQLGGAGVWDIVVDAPAELDTAFLDLVRTMESDLRGIRVEGAALTKVLSLADAEAVARRSTLAAMLPASARLSAMSLVMPAFFDALLTQPQQGRRRLRIMLRSEEQLESHQKLSLIDAVQQCVHRHTTSRPWKAAVAATDAAPARRGTVTGYYVLMARLVSQLIRDQWWCFLISGISVWLLLIVATRSTRLATAALLPNLLPILLVIGSLGILGGRTNMGVAMIAAVSIGISIDGSVHFLYAYQRAIRRGHRPDNAGRPRRRKHRRSHSLSDDRPGRRLRSPVDQRVHSDSDLRTLVASTLALGTTVNLTLLPSIVVAFDRAPGRRTADQS